MLVMHCNAYDSLCSLIALRAAFELQLDASEVLQPATLRDKLLLWHQLLLHHDHTTRTSSSAIMKIGFYFQLPDRKRKLFSRDVRGVTAQYLIGIAQIGLRFVNPFVEDGS
jgi:hypothetical protein